MADTMQSSFARYEQKYFLTPAQLAALLARIAPHIQRDAHARYTICNLYYDTDDWRLIRASLEKPVYKEKLRVRGYGVPADGDGVFAEIKKKYAGVVYKRRITLSPADAAAFLRTGKSAAPLGQIGREIAWFQRTYHAEPKVFLAYDRTAFAGVDDPAVRITFDTDIRWRTTALDLRRGDYGAPLLPPGQILMELKLPGACPLWLSRALTDIGARQTSFSKYGACYKTCILPTETFSKEALCSA